MDVDEPRLERCLVRLARRGGKREQRAAVIAGTQGDDAVLARLPALDPVLSGELQCGFDRLGAATKEVELREIAWERVGDLVGQVFDRPVREHRARQVAELPALLGDRIGDLGIGVAEVRDVRAADGVEVTLAALVDQPASLAADDFGVLVAELAVEDVAVRVVVARHTRKAIRH